MAEAQQVVESSEQALAALAAAQTSAEAASMALVVLVRAAVPEWLAHVVQTASAQAVPVDVVLDPDDLSISGAPGAEQRDGWEIGAITAALSLGVRDVMGADARRVARVRAVLGHLAAAAAADPDGTAEVVR